MNSFSLAMFLFGVVYWPASDHTHTPKKKMKRMANSSGVWCLTFAFFVSSKMQLLQCFLNTVHWVRTFRVIVVTIQGIYIRTLNVPTKAAIIVRRVVIECGCVVLWITQKVHLLSDPIAFIWAKRKLISHQYYKFSIDWFSRSPLDREKRPSGPIANIPIKVCSYLSFTKAKRQTRYVITMI